MTPLVACAEAAKLDRLVSASVPPLVLMEDASLLLWQALEPVLRESAAGREGALVALVGPGDNGGDALALLRHASFSGLPKLGAILAREAGGAAAAYAASLRSLGLPLLVWDGQREACERLLDEALLIIDGLSGSGISGRLRGPSLSILEALAQRVRSERGLAPIASIDLPSGLSDALEPGWPLVQANWTLSIEPRKACLYHPAARSACGEILPIRGVFPAEARIEPLASLLDAADLADFAPSAADTAYKGERGRVAVFAGDRGTSGAAVIATRAALAAGAGLATLYARPEIYSIVASRLDSAMARPEPEASTALELRADALLVGPGWGKGADRRDRLASLLELGLPTVLDADAILLFKELADSGFSARGPLLLTPHPGEFRALVGIATEDFLAAPANSLKAASARFAATIVLKSHVTWIASPEGELAVWEGMEAGLATAGSGDALAGLAAGLLARLAAEARERGGSASSGEAFSAARAAVIAHGLAGRAARAELGWFEATDILPRAAKLLGGRRNGGARFGARPGDPRRA
jgi:ADP-dependent NAD(P)H-hydrate dehydratase / NAD(P)H-hydrate epimerase